MTGGSVPVTGASDRWVGSSDRWVGSSDRWVVPVTGEQVVNRWAIRWANKWQHSASRIRKLESSEVWKLDTDRRASYSSSCSRVGIEASPTCSNVTTADRALARSRSRANTIGISSFVMASTHTSQSGKTSKPFAGRWHRSSRDAAKLIRACEVRDVSARDDVHPR